MLDQVLAEQGVHIHKGMQVQGLVVGHYNRYTVIRHPGSDGGQASAGLPATRPDLHTWKPLIQRNIGITGIYRNTEFARGIEIYRFDYAVFGEIDRPAPSRLFKRIDSTILITVKKIKSGRLLAITDVYSGLYGIGNMIERIHAAEGKGVSPCGRVFMCQPEQTVIRATHKRNGIHRAVAKIALEIIGSSAALAIGYGTGNMCGIAGSTDTAIEYQVANEVDSLCFGPVMAGTTKKHQ